QRVRLVREPGGGIERPRSDAGARRADAGWPRRAGGGIRGRQPVVRRPELMGPRLGDGGVLHPSLRLPDATEPGERLLDDPLGEVARSWPRSCWPTLGAPRLPAVPATASSV